MQDRQAGVADFDVVYFEDGFVHIYRLQLFFLTPRQNTLFDVGRSMFDVYFLVNPYYKTSQRQSFFFDETIHFWGQRLGWH